LEDDRGVCGIPCSALSDGSGTGDGPGFFFLVLFIVVVILEERSVRIGLRLEVFKTFGNILIAFHEEFGEVTSQVSGGKRRGVRWGNVRSKNFIAVVVKARGEAAIADSTGSTDAVDVLVDVVGEVIINDVHDILYVEATCGNVGGDEDGSLPIPEGDHGVLSTST
jgi:hypothetical protein